MLNKQKDIERRKRMNAEVNNISKLDNCHLTKIVFSNAAEFENIDVKLYYVSEYIDGCTLEEFVESNDISFEEAIDFFFFFL